MKYIYESPDGGNTVYRHPLGHPDKRELVTDAPDEIVIEDQVINLNSWLPLDEDNEKLK